MCKSRHSTAFCAAAHRITGYCVDGLRCDAPGTGTCQACSAAPGTARPIGVSCYGKPNTVQRIQCQSGFPLCGHHRMSTGVGASRHVSQRVARGTPICAANTVTGKICDGLAPCGSDPVATVRAPRICWPRRDLKQRPRFSIVHAALDPYAHNWLLKR